MPESQLSNHTLIDIFQIKSLEKVEDDFKAPKAMDENIISKQIIVKCPLPGRSLNCQ